MWQKYSHIIKCKKKNKRTTECDKSTITYDVGIAQCEDGTVKCEKKNKGTTECDKSIVTCYFVLHNVRMMPSNVRKKK